MWENVIAGATYGAIGGAAGALLGALLASFIKGGGRMIAVALTVIGAVAGPNFARPLLEPHIGKYLPAPKAAAADDLESQLKAEFAKLNDPMMNAIIKREPKLIEQLSGELEDVVRTASSPISARTMAFAAASNKVSGRLIHYLKRGRDEDLVAFGVEMVRGLDVLSGRDARFCFNSLYNPGALSNLQIQDFREKYGAEQYDRQQAVAGRLIERAFDSPPAYDAEIGAAGVQRAAAVLQEMLGEEGLPMITGGRQPKDDAEAKLACDASAAMYRSILQEEQAAIVLRHVFTISG